MSVLIMLVLISVLIIAHELGHFAVARWCGMKVERFGFGLPFGPTLWSKKIGDVEYCIHAFLFGGYVAFPDDNPDSPVPKDSPQRFENQPLWNRFAVAIAGVTVNAILGWAIMVFVILGWGYPTGEAAKAVLVADMPAATAPAGEAGIQKGDQLYKINGEPIPGKDFTEMMTAVPKMIGGHANETITITVLRNDQPVELSVTPNEKGLIGIVLGGVPEYKKVTNPVEASTKATEFLGRLLNSQIVAFGQLFSGQMDMKELAGPIRIVSEGAKMIDQTGIQTGLMLTAMISVILAFMNILPIPALDGGHILFILIEAIKGSPVKKEYQERFTQLGFIGLMALIGFIIWNDVSNVVGPLFKQ